MERRIEHTIRPIYWVCGYADVWLRVVSDLSKLTGTTSHRKEVVQYGLVYNHRPDVYVPFFRKRA